jgi:DNA-binding transcriptional MerR regulator
MSTRRVNDLKTGQFVTLCRTTKDTVRYYEALGLIQPAMNGAFKDFRKTEVEDFQAIKDMQRMGLSLKTIQKIFSLKRTYGCGSSHLIQNILEQLMSQRSALAVEEAHIRDKITYIDQLIVELKNLHPEEMGKDAAKEQDYGKTL